MLAKLSSALQTVKEVCQENTLTLNMSAGKTEATVLLQGKQSKEMERRMLRRLRRTQRFWRRQLDRFVWWAATVTWAAVLTVPCTQNAELAARRSSAQAAAVALGHSVLGDQAIPTKVRTCVARSTIHSRLPPPSWKVDVPEQNTAASSAPLRRILGQHKPPEPGTHRMRDDEILLTLKVPLEAQLLVDTLRLAAQIATSQQALSMVVSSAGLEWR